MATITLGQTATISKIFTQDDVLAFSHLSLDFNPIHLDPEFAKNTVYGESIVHGMLVSSLFSALLGSHLPGKGTIYLGQDIKFIKPIFLNRKVTASVEVFSIREDKPIITLNTICKNNEGEIAISGHAVVMYNP